MTFSSGYSSDPVDPRSALDIQKEAIANAAALKGYAKQQNGLYGNSSDGTSGGGSSSSTGIGGTGNAFGLSDFTSASQSATDLAKNMAQFQLGINDQQSSQDQKYRFAEAANTLGNTEALNRQQFGNTYALAGQQNTANLGLDAQRNTAAMSQLTKQTDTQQQMQAADFNNQTTQRAQQAALAQIGYHGR